MDTCGPLPIGLLRPHRMEVVYLIRYGMLSKLIQFNPLSKAVIRKHRGDIDFHRCGSQLAARGPHGDELMSKVGACFERTT